MSEVPLYTILDIRIQGAQNQDLTLKIRIYVTQRQDIRNSIP